MKRRRAGGSARRVAHRMCASFSPVHGCTVEKPRRPDANPRAARALNPGRLSLGYLSLAKQRKVTRTPKADETGRTDHEQGRVPRSHRDRSPRIAIAVARMNPRGRAFRRSYMEQITANRNPRREAITPGSRLPTLPHPSGSVDRVRTGRRLRRQRVAAPRRSRARAGPRCCRTGSRGSCGRSAAPVPRFRLRSD
jgi:hypothetical protein